MSKFKGQHLDNSLRDLAVSVKTASLVTGGSYLSGYGSIAFANNYSLITLNRIILTYLYTGNGIFQTAIQLPIQDALSKGIRIESSELDADQMAALIEWMESPFTEESASQTPWETIMNMYTWVRLYGGGGLVINADQDPALPLSVNELKNDKLELYDIDRWQMDTAIYAYRDDVIEDQWVDQEYYYIHGIKIHNSRVIRTRGKRAPYYIRRQLRGWGMSEGERMIRDLNLFLKSQDVLYEIIDESKIDVYKIKNFASKLLQRGGTEKIQNRITIANELKNYVNALILDAEEEYQQKTMNFTGLADVMSENRIGIASALRMPMTKLFGISASGFNTGQSDLENYNAMIESEVRTPMRPVIRKVLELGCIKLFGYIPTFTFQYPSLRVLSAMDEESVKVSQQNRAMALFDRGIFSSTELARIGRKEGWIDFQVKAEKGWVDPAKAGVAGQGAGQDQATRDIPKPSTSTEMEPFSEEWKFR